MTYETRDRSVSDGAPIECYNFFGSNGIFRYTSYHSPLTVNGMNFVHKPVTRTAVETGSVVDGLATMDFNVPSDDPLAKAYAFMLNPRDFFIEVLRVHEGDDYSTEFKVEWKGEGLGFAASGKWATMKTGSVLQSKLSGNLSSVFYQGSCNHILFDERCKMVRATFTSSTTVTRIQNQIITVANDGVADHALDGGEIVNTRTGETRTIISNVANVLRIGSPFIDVVLGDTVELTLGCDHARLGDCKLVYNNVPNYGGFDFIPTTNPFASVTNQTFTETTVKKNRSTVLTKWSVSSA